MSAGATLEKKMWSVSQEKSPVSSLPTLCFGATCIIINTSHSLSRKISVTLTTYLTCTFGPIVKHRVSDQLSNTLHSILSALMMPQLSPAVSQRSVSKLSLVTQTSSFLVGSHTHSGGRCSLNFHRCVLPISTLCRQSLAWWRHKWRQWIPVLVLVVGCHHRVLSFSPWICPCMSCWLLSAMKVEKEIYSQSSLKSWLFCSHFDFNVVICSSFSVPNPCTGCTGCMCMETLLLQQSQLLLFTLAKTAFAIEAEDTLLSHSFCSPI